MNCILKAEQRDKSLKGKKNKVFGNGKIGFKING